MSGKCAVNSCQKPSADLFSSPEDPVVLDKWKTFLDVSENEFVVCSLHFDDRDIETRRILRADACPVNTFEVSEEQASCGCCSESISSKEPKIRVDKSVREMMRNLLEIEVS
jgi:hypothetical protein